MLLDSEDGAEIGVCDIGTADGVYKCKVKNVTGRHAVFFMPEHGVTDWTKDYFDGKLLFEFEEFVFMK